MRSPRRLRGGVKKQKLEWQNGKSSATELLLKGLMFLILLSMLKMNLHNQNSAAEVSSICNGNLNNYQSKIYIFRFKRVPEVPLCLPHPTPQGQDQSRQVPGQEQSQDQDRGPSSLEGDLCSRRRPRETLRIFSMKLWRF